MGEGFRCDKCGGKDYEHTLVCVPCEDKRDAVYDAAMAVVKLGRVGLAAYPRFPSYSTFAKEWDAAMARLIECADQAEEVERG